MSTDHLTIKELLKLCRLTAAQLATEMGLEYGQVSTAVSMDSAGQEPKRQSVRQRQAEIREYLEQQLANEEGSSARNARASLYESPETCRARLTEPAGATVEYEYGRYKLGDYIRLDLDGQGVALYRFVRKVSRGALEPWIDVFGGDNGGMRSVRVSKVPA